jgi:hypothetical protein
MTLNNIIRKEKPEKYSSKENNGGSPKNIRSEEEY